MVQHDLSACVRPFRLSNERSEKNSEAKFELIVTKTAPVDVQTEALDFIEPPRLLSVTFYSALLPKVSC